MTLEPQDPRYADWLEGLKDTIRRSRVQTSFALNAALIGLYWTLGREILSRQREQGWGAKVVDQVAADLGREFPDMKGLSRSNLNAMRAFARAWPNPVIFQQAVGKLPWGHNTLLLNKLSTESDRRWYAEHAIENNWSRNRLLHEIETKSHERDRQAVTNFELTMTPDRARLAIPVFKDPYILDFITLTDDAHERYLERALIDQVQKLLMDLGSGFAFIGSQYHLEISQRDFYIDLLFYHTKLHSHIAVELKMGEFEPEYAGKMNFYLAALDDTVRTPGDEPSIGLILCRGKDGIVVEYALGSTSRPMAVADYKVLPPELADALPSPEYIVDRLEALNASIEPEPDEPAAYGPA